LLELARDEKLLFVFVDSIELTEAQEGAEVATDVDEGQKEVRPVGHEGIWVARLLHFARDELIVFWLAAIDVTVILDRHVVKEDKSHA